MSGPTRIAPHGWSRLVSTLALGALVTLLVGVFCNGALAAEPTSKSKSAQANACMTPDPGYGIYDHWSRRISMGQLLAPQRGGLTKSGGFDLLIHFHGHYPVRKEFVKTANGIVLVAIDLGIGSGAYSSAFASPGTFEALLKSVEAEMARLSGRKSAHIRKLGLSSWSAGYGAIMQILGQPAGKKVDALILLDSLYGGYVEGTKDQLQPAPLQPFVDFARKAARGQKFMFESFSSIQPPGYASTGEVAHYIVKKLGGKLRKTSRSDVLGLQMFERYDRSNYHVRGYRGDDKPDHCAHLGLMADVVKVYLNKRWHPPRGRKGKRPVSTTKVAVVKSGGTHTVVSGDTLGEIAIAHGVSSSALRAANGLGSSSTIRVGQELIIPGASGGTAKPTPGRRASTKASKGERRHKVYAGQTLGGIARRYNVTVNEIRERNGIEVGGRKIRPGDELVIPAD